MVNAVQLKTHLLVFIHDWILEVRLSDGRMSLLRKIKAEGHTFHMCTWKGETATPAPSTTPCKWGRLQNDNVQYTGLGAWKFIIKAPAQHMKHDHSTNIKPKIMKNSISRIILTALIEQLYCYRY
jgi:hypothetical protein